MVKIVFSKWGTGFGTISSLMDDRWSKGKWGRIVSNNNKKVRLIWKQTIKQQPPLQISGRTDLLFTLNSPSQWNVISIYTNIKLSITPADPVAFDLWTHLNAQRSNSLYGLGQTSQLRFAFGSLWGRQDEGVEGERWDTELCPMGSGRGCCFLLGA